MIPNVQKLLYILWYLDIIIIIKIFLAKLNQDASDLSRGLSDYKKIAPPSQSPENVPKINEFK